MEHYANICKVVKAYAIPESASADTGELLTVTGSQAKGPFPKKTMEELNGDPDPAKLNQGVEVMCGRGGATQGSGNASQKVKQNPGKQSQRENRRRRYQ